MIESNLHESVAYNWMIVTYFFFGGLGAGSYIFSVVANYWKQEYKPLAKTGAILAPIVISFGMLFLLLDLGRPLGVWRIFLHFNPTSAISWGTWFLNIFIGLSLIYAWFLIKNENEKAKKFAFAGLLFAFLVATYTAIILAQAPGIEMWRHTAAILPWLFLIGGLISGIAFVILVSSGTQETALLAKLGKVLGGLVIFELLIVFVDVVVLYNGGEKAIIAVGSYISGEFSFLFWVVEILIGSLIPVYILFRKKITASALSIASMLILIGIYAMRYIVVIGGQVTG